MKFGKEFASQMVPEWKEAYMDYTYLKSLLKQILDFKQLKKPELTASKGLNRRMTLYRAFSGLTRRCSNSFKNPRVDLEEQSVILVNAMQNEGTDAAAAVGVYETMFLMSSDEGGEYEVVYFKRLDDEFNKVVKFYKEKVEEVMNEAAILSKQMDALIAFRIKVEDPEGSMNWSSVEMDGLSSNISMPETATRKAQSQSTAREGAGSVHMDVINETGQLQDESPGDDTRCETKKTAVQAVRPASLEILNHVKLNNTLETPRSTVKGILKLHSNTLLQFNQVNLTRVEEKLRLAFVEFYQKLRVLKSYSFLNVLAFSKIMKKYDKIAVRNASKSYMKMVDNSYLGSSDEVNKLIERVEATFIKHFANANHSKGINILRPKAKRERHRVTYALGFLSGCTAALLLTLVLIIRARQIIGRKGTKTYMENMFPLYSLFGFIVLHIIMYGLNIVFWKCYRVHYTFIFGFKQGTELGYREVFLLGAGLATLALASVLANLDMEMEEITKDYKVLTELVPLGLVTLVLLITVCPFNIIYRSSRFFLLTCVFHCICAPLYKVSLSDFFLADQLTSQVQAFRSLEFYVCYYGWGDFKRRETTCKEMDLYIIFNFIVATIPYVWRALQCLRRLFEEKDSMHGYNALKYFSTIIAVCTITAYRRNNTFNWKVMAWTSSAIAVFVSTYWDLVIDWGLLQPNSKNPWLRDKLLVSKKIVYFGAMVLNVLLRLAWMQTVLRFEVPSLHTEALITIVACLEIIRRGIWNFFRLENEHLNNVGKYRAFKSVPLPFNYHEDGDKAK